MIKAEAHSDDRIYEAVFDATPYFEQASDTDLLDLAECGYGGDDPADHVAHFMADRDSSVAAIFDYLAHYNRFHSGHLLGFECHVDEEQAERWLRENRPELHRRIKKEIEI